MNTLDNLIAAFVAHTTVEIEADGSLLLAQFGKPNRQELMAVPDFSRLYNLVLECAQSVDELVANFPAEHDQVSEAVKLLRRLVDDLVLEERINTTLALVKGRLRDARWSQPQQDRFDSKLDLLKWKDFFISYTDRDAPSTNERFKKLLRTTLSSTPAKANGKNFVARALAKHLGGYQQLSGFFAEDKLKIGEIVQNEVDGYCNRAFALIQLIEPLSFQREPPKNWCFHEYQVFTGTPVIQRLFGDKNRHFFILVDAPVDNVIPANLAATYTGWRDRLKFTKHVSLDPKTNNYALRPVTQEIADQIKTIRTEIITAWAEE